MRIVDPRKNKIDLGYDDSRDTIGIVFKTQEEFNGKPMLGVIIPKFMLGYSFTDNERAKEESIELNNDKCMNDDSEGQFWSSDVVIKNYITVRPLLNENRSMPTYTIGDKVIITMIDDDIKTLAFLPYTINRLGQRATDEIILAIPANTKENTELKENNTYVLYMNSDKDEQVIRLQTANKNGETCVHTFEFNSRDGIVTITDNQERSWVMNTKEDSITSKTSGTTIQQIGDKINNYCDTYNIFATTKIHFETEKYELECSTMHETCDKGVFDQENITQNSTKASINISSENHNYAKYKHSGGKFNISAGKHDFDSPVYAPVFIKK